MLEPSIAGSNIIGLNRNGKGLLGAEEDDKLFTSGDSGIKEIPKEKLEVGGMDRDDDAGALTPLIFMDRYGVGKHELIDI